MNQLDVSLQHSIATLTAKGWSARKVARELGVDRETVSRYLRLDTSKPAIPPAGSQSLSEPNPAIPPIGSPEPADSKPAILPIGPKVGRTSQCLPLAEVIEHCLLAGLSAQRIYQDLVQEHAFSGAYDAVKRYVRHLQNRRQVRSVAWSVCPAMSCRWILDKAPGPSTMESDERPISSEAC
jgi:IS30 family transposase